MKTDKQDLGSIKIQLYNATKRKSNLHLFSIGDMRSNHVVSSQRIINEYVVSTLKSFKILIKNVVVAESVLL